MPEGLAEPGSSGLSEVHLAVSVMLKQGDHQLCAWAVAAAVWRTAREACVCLTIVKSFKMEHWK